MMTSVKFSKILAVILTVMLMITLLPCAVFATDADTTTAAADVTTAGDVTTSSPSDETTAGATDSTTAAGDETTKAPTSETTAQSSTSNKKDDGPNWDLIISLSIIGLLVVAFAICFAVIPKFRERVKKFFSDYKSELKKVVWSPWREVRKNTILVLVVVAAVALVIFLLDTIFSGGISALGTLL